MTNQKSNKDNVFYTLELTKTQVRVLLIVLAFATISTLAVWVGVSEHNIHTQQKQQTEQLKLELEECRAEATAWYNSSTALSDAIALAALKGLPAEKVDTNIAIPFAVKGHELNCIRPKFPTG